jgi:predicted RNA binding protein YcfA (HicA-like mRNA interferase family)
VRIPRDVNGPLLAERLRRHRYVVTRQTGSHMRLSRSSDGQQQHLTIPAHKPLRVGTLRQILKEVAYQLGCSIEELIDGLGFECAGIAAEAEGLQVAEVVRAALVPGHDGVHLQGPLVRGLL